jgi:hypothetical protein
MLAKVALVTASITQTGSDSGHVRVTDSLAVGFNRSSHPAAASLQ